MTDAQEPPPERSPGIEASILVPVLNEAAHLEASVASMAAQAGGEHFEILLVDGGSQDGTPAILERLAAANPRVRVLRNPRRVIPSGLNVALAAARGRYVVRMDAHTRYPSDYVRRGIERLQRGDTRWVSGPQVPEGVGPISRATAVVLTSALGHGGSRRWGSAAGSGEHELDSGVFCGIWERAVLLSYGGWDERWARNEDSELASRFIERGERLVCSGTMAAAYSPRESLRALTRQYLGNGRFRAKTAVRHPRSFRPTNVLPVGVAVVSVMSLGGRTRPAKLARHGVRIYLGVVALATAQLGPGTESAAEALAVPMVIVGMHLPFGLGFLGGLIGELRAAWADPAGSVLRSPEVYAPSLASPVGP